MSKILKSYQLNLRLEDDSDHPGDYTGVYRGCIELPKEHQFISRLCLAYPYYSNLTLELRVIVEDLDAKKNQKYEFIAIDKNVSQILIGSFTFFDSCISYNNGEVNSYDVFYRKLS